MKLEELQKGVLVDGLVPGHIATIVSADAIGANIVDHEPEPGTASVNYQLDYLLSKAKKPEEV